MGCSGMYVLDVYFLENFRLGVDLNHNRKTLQIEINYVEITSSGKK